MIQLSIINAVLLWNMLCDTQTENVQHMDQTQTKYNFQGKEIYVTKTMYIV